MKSRSFRNVLVLLVIVVGVLALLVAFSPSILSTSGGRRFVLRRVNKAAPGTLSVEAWSLSWQSGLELNDILYRDDEGTVSVRVDEVRLDRGLLDLARDYHHFGTVEIDRPVIHVTTPSTPPDGAASVTSTPTPSEASAEPMSAEADLPSSIDLPDLYGQVRVRDGHILLTRAGGDEESVLETITVDLDLDGLANPVHYRVEGQSGVADGLLESEGSVTIGADGPRSPDRVEINSDLLVQSLDLKPLTDVAAALADVPTATGILNSKLSVVGSLSDGLRVHGNVFVPDLRVSGGPLGADTPALGQVVLVLDATYIDESMQVSNLMIRTSVIKATVQGNVVDASKATIAAAADVDLGELFAQFPETLSVREGLAVTGGTLSITSEVTRVDEAIAFDVNASLEGLRGNLDGEAVSWDAPTALAARGEWAPTAWRLDTLEFHSPFLDVNGQGNPQRAHLTVGADLAAAQRELGTFIRLDDWTVSGNAAIDLTINEVGEGARVVQSRLEATDAMLARGGMTFVPKSALRADLSGRLETDGTTVKPGIMRPSLSWDAWLGSGRISSDSVTFNPSDGADELLPEISGLTASGEIDLAALTRLLHGLEALPPDQGLAGRATYDVAGDVRPEGITMKDVHVGLAEFSVSVPNGSVQDDLGIDLSGRIGVADRLLEVPTARIQSTAGSVLLRGLRAGPVEDAFSLSVYGEAALDLGRLFAMVSDVVDMPDGTTVSGKGKMGFQLGLDPGKANEVKIEAYLEPLRVMSEGRPLVNEEQVKLVAQVTQDGAGEAVHVRELDLASGPLTMRGSGSWTGSGDRNAVKADGTFALDLEILAAYLQAFAGVDIQMRGRDQQAFSFTSEWVKGSQDGLLRGASFQTALRADEIHAFGLSVQDLQVPFTLSDGVARADVSAGVNEGTVRVTPVIDLAAEPRTLTLENPTNLLTNVELTNEMADQLLGRIHPLFRGASVVGGTASLGMDHFVWPLDAAYRNQARFAGTLDLRDLRMQTTGMLNRLLEAIKVNEREMDIGDRVVTFVCENERITCSPMKIDVEDSLVTISGSMGLDQTLDYIAELPVTQDLVGRDAFPYLEGTSIRVPIRGTASDPDLRLRVLQDAAADLARQALQKALKEKAGKLLEGLLQQPR